MTTNNKKRCKVCGKPFEFINIWSVGEIGTLNWTEKDKKWFLENEPVCNECTLSYFAQYFDEWGKLK